VKKLKARYSKKVNLSHPSAFLNFVTSGIKPADVPPATHPAIFIAGALAGCLPE
jgi:hypothetical protein